MVIIEKDQIEKLKNQIRKNPLEVSCGAILGYNVSDTLVVQSLMELKNEKFENKKNGYLISPEQYIVVENFACREGFEILGFYYSSNKAEPTDYDRNFSLPGILYLIATKKSNEEISISGWELNDNRKYFNEHNIEVNIKKGQYIQHKLALAV